MRQVLILGGYGNFGKRIAQLLTKSGVAVIIAGRNAAKADALKQQLPEGLADTACFNARTDLPRYLQSLKPAVVINTCGPFQNSDYSIAEHCIAAGVHYIDLADGREFVRGFARLHDNATQANITVITGASTVPGLSSAVIDNYKDEFSSIDSIRFGISPGQKAERGLATTRAIMSYVGKPLAPSPGQTDTVYGWQNLHRQSYPTLGKRWMANCDIPDADLLPEHYGIPSVRFSAGLELGFMHIILWGLSWAVRTGIPLHLPRWSKPLLALSNLFDGFGSADGGMHVILSGTCRDGMPHTRTWFIVARDGDGPYIPTVPAVILARKLIRQEVNLPSVSPCVGLVTLEDYLAELQDFNVTVSDSHSPP